MAAPKGHERYGGRQKGTPNKATADVKALAGKYGPKAVDALAVLAGLKTGGKPAESEAARVAALKEILDRAYGKASQPIGGADDLPAIRTALEVAFVGVRSNGQG